MLIGHRFERTPQGDLHIHSRNLMMEVAAPLCGAIACAAPLAFVFFAVIHEPSPLIGLDPLALLLIVLGLLLFPALGLVITVYTGMRETLLLSRVDNQGKRRTRNYFGRRERLHEVFRLDAAKYLELRRRPHAEPAYTQLWLVLRDGSEHRLTTNNVPVVPGSKRTDLWLRELADYLQVPVPTEIVDPAVPRPAPYRPAPAPNRKRAAKAARPGNASGSTPPGETTDALSMPTRAFLTLLGAFLAVLELTHIPTLLSALFTGRLRVSGFRTGSHTFHWAEQPWVFSFNLLAGIAEVLIIGVIAWGCLRAALTGRFKAKP